VGFAASYIWNKQATATLYRSAERSESVLQQNFYVKQGCYFNPKKAVTRSQDG
jgi:hypothetical protein